ncbi:esterase [Pontibacillus halophilus JSM 076056 = DSM 19796]|uniref:Putative 2-succinyl-6-hydroxy-2,4-cyclohexadiene-1-carboxylate synthase n=1 Tax=Pontibacillus halophilus JSM 076056 = DSM 19796 TaxID=1385510 RepID=A0A0A5GBZ4_9BACI|nr:2-succinyl-6-hydroxy-2,4-cyclohexadiene-1-carboxylate synthase [Pontibacillus halophilus]KGX89514.1 esterase [Pontibacillus halophilus JSM 076056 = DSM 19796]
MRYSINGNDYDVHVAGEGEPILLLHGFTGKKETWSTFQEEWSKRYRTIAVDLPGHGGTEVNAPFTMENVCKDLSFLLDELSMKDVHILGYSMGGRTALSFAMMYPNRVRTLMLESASPGLRASHEQLMRQTKDEQLAKEIERNGIVAFVDRWERLPMFSSQLTLPEETKQQIRSERLTQSEFGLAASLRGMGTGIQPSWWDAIGDFHRPVLLITGELDEKFTTIAEEMRSVLSSATHKIVSQSGHAIHVEQPRKFVKIVEDFIQSNGFE